MAVYRLDADRKGDGNARDDDDGFVPRTMRARKLCGADAAEHIVLSALLLGVTMAAVARGSHSAAGAAICDTADMNYPTVERAGSARTNGRATIAAG